MLNQDFEHTSIEVKLHRAFINKQKTHTILKIKIDKQIYFCDVGMGFPISKLIPSNKNIEFTSYGIQFKSVANNSKIIVYIDEGNGEQELMQIVQEEQSQKEVKKEISERWKNKEKLPFNNKLRYFFIHNDKYYQIKNDKYVGKS
jgi:arylamine N-acetyltransferase